MITAGRPRGVNRGRRILCTFPSGPARWGARELTFDTWFHPRVSRLNNGRAHRFATRRMHGAWIANESQRHHRSDTCATPGIGVSPRSNLCIPHHCPCSYMSRSSQRRHPQCLVRNRLRAGRGCALTARTSSAMRAGHPVLACPGYARNAITSWSSCAGCSSAM
jgi:hypothetical protein